MNTVARVGLLLALLLAIKTIFNHGVTASPQEYFQIVTNTRIVEYIMGIALAFSFIAFRNSRQWYFGSFSTSRSTRLMKGDDGSLKEMVVQESSATSDHDQAKRAYYSSVLVFISCLISSAVISLFWK